MIILLSSGGKTWWDPAMWGLCHDTRKALGSSCCWRFGTSRKVQEGSVGCFSRYRHNLGSWFLSRWNWHAPLGGRYLTNMSMRTITKQCSMSQKMAFPTGSQPADMLTKGSQNTSFPGSLSSPTYKEIIYSLNLHICQPSFRLGLYLSNNSVTWAAVTEYEN